MKLTVTQFGGMSQAEKSITAKVFCHADVSSISALSLMPCLLSIGDKKLRCTSGKTAQADSNGVVSFQLYFEDNIEVWLVLHPLHHKAADCTLLVGEKIPQALRMRVEELLAKLESVTGRGRKALLLEMTTFRPGRSGKDDLDFISEKQLKVIIDKMEHMLADLH